MTTTTDTTPTDRQLRVYHAILHLTARHGVPPTVREIGAACGIKHPNGVMANVLALRRKGWLEADDGIQTSRAIMPAEMRQAIKDAARLILIRGRAAK